MAARLRLLHVADAIQISSVSDDRWPGKMYYFRASRRLLGRRRPIAGTALSYAAMKLARQWRARRVAAPSRFGYRVMPPAARDILGAADARQLFERFTAASLYRCR